MAGLSPVAYWRLGEASGTSAADSAGTNPGTYAGGPTLGQPGLLTGDPSTAVRFDGVNDQVTVPSSASLNQTSRLSITAWFTANAGGWDQPRNAADPAEGHQRQPVPPAGRVRPAQVRDRRRRHGHRRAALDRRPPLRGRDL